MPYESCDMTLVLRFTFCPFVRAIIICFARVPGFLRILLMKGGDLQQSYAETIPGGKRRSDLTERDVGMGWPMKSLNLTASACPTLQGYYLSTASSLLILYLVFGMCVTHRPALPRVFV